MQPTLIVVFHQKNRKTDDNLILEEFDENEGPHMQCTNVADGKLKYFKSEIKYFNSKFIFLS